MIDERVRAVCHDELGAFRCDEKQPDYMPIVMEIKAGTGCESGFALLKRKSTGASRSAAYSQLAADSWRQIPGFVRRRIG